MGFKCVLIALALVVCLSSMTFGLGPKDYVASRSRERTCPAARYTRKFREVSIQT